MTAWAREFGLWGLFISAFLSSTLAPGGSEAVIAYLAGLGHSRDSVLLCVATLGNTLGALTTLALGHWLAGRCPPEAILESRRAKAIGQVRDWGWPLLLFSWLPVVGDGFCFAAGWLRLPFWRSLLAIAAGKAFGYAAILWAWAAFAGATG